MSCCIGKPSKLNHPMDTQAWLARYYNSDIQMAHLNIRCYDLTPIQRTVEMSGASKLLEGGRAEIAQRRMPPLTVVPHLDVLEDRLTGCRP